MIYEELVRKRIKEARIARGLSYEEVAKEMTAKGCPTVGSTVWKIVTGNRKITVNELLVLSWVFDFDLYDFDKIKRSESEFARGVTYGRDLGRQEAADEMIDLIKTHLP